MSLAEIGIMAKSSRKARKRAKAKRERQRGNRGAPTKASIERSTPTPETEANLQADILKDMTYWHGNEPPLIDSAGEAAAYEIRAVYRAICRDVMVQISRSPGHGGKSEMPEHLAEAHAQRYVPWVAAAGPRIVDATLRVVVEGEEPWTATKREVARALGEYAVAMPAEARRRMAG